MLSRLGDIIYENKCVISRDLHILEEKIDRNQNDIDEFNNSINIMEDKLNNSTSHIARLDKTKTDKFHMVENEIGHVKNNFKYIVPQLKTDLRKDLKVELNSILKQEISIIKDTLQQEITVIVQGKNDSLQAELLDVNNSLRTELAEANKSLRGELTGINYSLQAYLANNVDSIRDELLNATNVHTVDVSSPETPPRWFTNYMSVSQSNYQAMTHNFQVLNKNVQAIDIRLQDSVQVADQRCMALQQQIMSVEQKVDNTEAIMGVTTGFSKFNDTLMSVQSKLDTL